MIVSGFAAFPVGRWLDRGSPRLLMTSGSVLATVGVLAWANSASVIAFYASWLLLGIAMGLVLYEPAQVVLIKQFGSRATWAITTLTLVAGFASTIFQPTIAALQDARGWRSALDRPRRRARCRDDHDPRPRPSRPSHQQGGTTRRGAGRRAGDARTTRDPAMTGLTIAFTLSIGAMSAAIVHLIPYLTDHGWTDVHAALAAALIGASQVAARVVFGIVAGRAAVARLALVVLLVPVGGIILLATSNGSAVAWAAVVLLGIGQGHHHAAAPAGPVAAAQPEPRTGAEPPRAQRGAPSPGPSPRSCWPPPQGSAPTGTRSVSPPASRWASPAPSSPSAASSSRLR